jgi:hypothetical protein
MFYEYHHFLVNVTELSMAVISLTSLPLFSASVIKRCDAMGVPMVFENPLARKMVNDIS